ncbi:MAG: LptE family protein [Deltaproteobacteria bacterium]|nr:LptE family protein [Candidatus Zymogenaceae bacterium]
MNIIKKVAPIGITLLIILSLTGCGYTFVNVKKQLGPDIKKVYIPAFENQTDEPSLGVIMTNALVREFMKSGALVPAKKESADAELIGTIKSVDYFNRIYNEEDRAVLVTITVHAGAKLVKGGDVVWEVSDLAYTEDYRIGTGAGILDSYKEIALEDLAQKLAVEFHDRLILGY